MGSTSNNYSRVINIQKPTCYLVDMDAVPQLRPVVLLFVCTESVDTMLPVEIYELCMARLPFYRILPRICSVQTLSCGMEQWSAQEFLVCGKGATAEHSTLPLLSCKYIKNCLGLCGLWPVRLLPGPAQSGRRMHQSQLHPDSGRWPVLKVQSHQILNFI